MRGDLDWDIDGAIWPNREHSHFIDAGGLRWHVQLMGEGPEVVLLHGTGAANHSWAGLAPLLARRYRVIAPDLPGHGFTSTASSAKSSLPGMAGAIGALLETLRANPTLAVGHSAGAAILARMCLDGAIRPVGLVSLNGALLPLDGVSGKLYSGSAKLLANIPLVPRLFARRAADRRVVERLIDQTGSTPPAETVKVYARLLNCEKHVSAALRMMANWDLGTLAGELGRLTAALHLVACRNDRTVPLSQARRLSATLPRARLHVVDGLGHLAHEEDPERIFTIIEEVADQLAEV